MLKSDKVAAFRYPEVWPLISYSTELHDLLEDFANPENWSGGKFKKGDIMVLAQEAIRRAPDRPHGSSTPIRWLTRACDNGHVWSELVAWKNERGWGAVTGKRNNANRPICPECGLMDSPKARHRLGIKS